MSDESATPLLRNSRDSVQLDDPRFSNLFGYGSARYFTTSNTTERISSPFVTSWLL
jgi:hypothetical protein